MQKAKKGELGSSTAFYVDCQIAKELGKSLQEYQALPRMEKKTWYYFHILANKKEEFSYEESRRNAEMRRPEKSSSRPPKFRE